MQTVYIKTLDESIIFLDYKENVNSIKNLKNLVVYNKEEQGIIQSLLPHFKNSPEDFLLIHSLKKEFGGIITKGGKDGISKSSSRRPRYPDGQRAFSEEQRSTINVHNPAESLFVDENVFEFFEDYRRFKEKNKKN